MYAFAYTREYSSLVNKRGKFAWMEAVAERAGTLALQTWWMHPGARQRACWIKSQPSTTSWSPSACSVSPNEQPCTQRTVMYHVCMCAFPSTGDAMKGTGCHTEGVLALNALVACACLALRTLPKGCSANVVQCPAGQPLPSPRKNSALRHCPRSIAAALSSMLPAAEACPLPMRERCRPSMRIAATAPSASEAAPLWPGHAPLPCPRRS